MSLVAALILAGSALAAPPRNFTTIQPSGTFDPEAATAVQTEYPKNHHVIRGRAVDHLWHIVLDNADYEDAANNEDLKALAQHGLVLDNYYAVEGNSQANYLAMLAGDTFGLNEERFVSLPWNVSTLVESMEAQHVLWAQYAEDQPFTAYAGWEYTANNASYSRAKNPFVAFDSIMENDKRYVNLRGLSSLQSDYDNKHFPQWLFIRPNLEHDGTNSNLATSAKWARDFLEPWVTDKKKSHRRIFILTFARASSRNGPNRVYTLILGDMHKSLRGTVSHKYYDHYSIPATTQANYDLPSLGRYDCSANVFDVVNYKAHIKSDKDPKIEGDYNQGPYIGYFSDRDVPLPQPNLNCEGRGHSGLLRHVKKIWKHHSLAYFEEPRKWHKKKHHKWDSA